MQQVADREHTGTAGPQASVHDWTARGGIDFQAADASELVVGNPVSSEYHGVAVDRGAFATVEVLDHHGAPVAGTTASAVTVRSPRGEVTCSTRSPLHPVTSASVSSTAPAS